MVLVCSPVGVEFVADLSIFLFLVGLPNEGVCQELRPRQPFRGRLIQQALKERFKFRAHIVREFNWILHNQMDQSVD